MSETGEIIFERKGGLGIATLNRAKALNSLTLEMCLAYDRQLATWAADESVRGVVIKGAGDRAFCAGGDVREIWRAGMNGESLTAEFFQAEYRMNRRLKRFPKPHIALLDGIVMGGGVGISLHGSHRIATERTLAAMPETSIGFFPDVGSTYVLSRVADGLGICLGLSGTRMKAADALHAGFATHYVPSARLDDLEAALAEAGDMDAAVRGFSEDPGPAPLAEHGPAIARCFTKDSVEAIFAALAAEPGEWAAKTLEIMTKRCSPTSLKIALEAIRRAAALDFDAAMVAEYRLSQACLAGTDSYEGIRALLVDKDNAPAWNPVTLEGVTAAMVEAHFAPLGDGELSFD